MFYTNCYDVSAVKSIVLTLSVIVSVSLTYLTSILSTTLDISTVLIIEEVMNELIPNELLMVVILNLGVLLLSYIIILSIVDVSLNTKVNVVGGGERIILSEVVFSIFPTSNVEMFPGVFIFSMSKVSLIYSIDNDGVTVSDGGKNWIYPITVDSSSYYVCWTFDTRIFSIESFVILVIWTFPFVKPEIDGSLVIPLIDNVAVSLFFYS